jgi:hypothetical protein
MHKSHEERFTGRQGRRRGKSEDATLCQTFPSLTGHFAAIFFLEFGLFSSK